MLLALSKWEKARPKLIWALYSKKNNWDNFLFPWVYIYLCDTGLSILNKENKSNTSRKSSPYLEIFYSKSRNMRNSLLNYIYFSLEGKLILIMNPACRRARETSPASWPKLTDCPDFLEKQRAMKYFTQISKLQVSIVQSCHHCLPCGSVLLPFFLALPGFLGGVWSWKTLS